MKDKITFEEFLNIEKKLEIKYGTIKLVERINKKMLKLTVDFNEEYLRTVITNIGARVDSDNHLIGYQFPFITNLTPATISGYESTAMIMIVEDENGNIQWPTNVDKFEDGSILF
jgi:tRNA-binding EMAP/Myf-like protein